ncbi:MAG TPA: hypothetical protein VHY78_02115 [Stellaceae bacterium]|nr:hypothetical protein [Stellaceae bacterium]
MTGGAISGTRNGWTHEIDATAASEYDHDRDRDINAEDGTDEAAVADRIALPAIPANIMPAPTMGSKGATVT